MEIFLTCNNFKRKYIEEENAKSKLSSSDTEQDTQTKEKKTKHIKYNIPQEKYVLFNRI